MLKLWCSGLLLLVISGCARDNFSSDSISQGKYSEKQLFTQAESSLAKGDYSNAVRYYEGLDSQYPFGQYAEQAQISLTYAYYKKGDYPATIAAADRYVHLYPRAAQVDYAYYMKGLANFEQDHGTFTRYLPLDHSLRDPGTAREAFNDFSVLVRRFPESKYVADAKQHMVYLRNMFARYELNVAEYYYDKRAYVAAVNRANYLVENYGTAPQAERALVLMVKANRKLGLTQSADDALAVLAKTYPGSSELKSLRKA
jgi:outer membrane protein assembly factor BamD